MARKLSLLLAAIAALAFAVPAMATAAVSTITDAGGNPLAVPTFITGTGSEVNITSTTLGSIKCSTITIEGVLSVNDMTNGFTISNAGQKAPPSTDCTNGKNVVNVTNVTLTDLESVVVGEALASFTAELDIGSTPTKCTFTGTNVKSTYANGGDVLTFTSAAGITGSPIACGSAKLDGSFTLELGNGAALEL